MILRTLKCYVGLTWQDKFGDDGLVKLSVLDYALIDEGKDAEKALQDSVTLAKLAIDLALSEFGLRNIIMYQRLRVVVQNF